MTYHFKPTYSEYRYSPNPIGSTTEETVEKASGYILAVLGMVALGLIAVAFVSKEKKKRKQSADRKREDAEAKRILKQEDDALAAYEKKHPRKSGESEEEWKHRVPLRWEASRYPDSRISMETKVKEYRSDLKSPSVSDSSKKRAAEKIRLYQQSLKSCKECKD